VQSRPDFSVMVKEGESGSVTAIALGKLRATPNLAIAAGGAYHGQTHAKPGPPRIAAASIWPIWRLARSAQGGRRSRDTRLIEALFGQLGPQSVRVPAGLSCDPWFKNSASQSLVPFWSTADTGLVRKPRTGLSTPLEKFWHAQKPG
jgi:hypothetical protein